jgi:hypothetical protein
VGTGGAGGQPADPRCSCTRAPRLRALSTVQGVGRSGRGRSSSRVSWPGSRRSFVSGYCVADSVGPCTLAGRIRTESSIGITPRFRPRQEAVAPLAAAMLFHRSTDAAGWACLRPLTDAATTGAGNARQPTPGSRASRSRRHSGRRPGAQSCHGGDLPYQGAEFADPDIGNGHLAARVTRRPGLSEGGVMSYVYYATHDYDDN